MDSCRLQAGKEVTAGRDSCQGPTPVLALAGAENRSDTIASILLADRILVRFTCNHCRVVAELPVEQLAE